MTIKAIISPFEKIVKPLVPRRALISVYNKNGVVELAKFLESCDVEILSTGGTLSALKDAGIKCVGVSDYTKSREVFNGRVKTLHPKIFGGLLYVRYNNDHEDESLMEDIPPIDMVICNLYPFNIAVHDIKEYKKLNYEHVATAVENIDIGGPSMIRAAAKNFQSVCVCCSPSQYAELIDEMKQTYSQCKSYGISLATRQRFSMFAYSSTAAYDSAISTFMMETESFVASLSNEDHDRDAKYMPMSVALTLTPQIGLKYGVNPHQKIAAISTINELPQYISTKNPIPSSLSLNFPIKILNGVPGYINFMDAIIGIQLVVETFIACNSVPVQELQKITFPITTLMKMSGDILPVAASFKHCSPAGLALGKTLSELDKQVFEIGSEYSCQSAVFNAYVRARNADPLCSFGDYVAIAGIVCEDTAKFLKKEVSDGIIALGYTDEAIKILSSKKDGKYAVIEVNENYFVKKAIAKLTRDHNAYTEMDMEMRTMCGLAFIQDRNSAIVYPNVFNDKIQTKNHNIPLENCTDLTLATSCIKYTQSNSVGCAFDNQMVGVAAGQQSRVDCVKLCGRKVATYFLRRHPKTLKLKFKAGVKKQERINARVAFIEGDMTDLELENYKKLFDDDNSSIEPLSFDEKREFMKSIKGVTMSSDAFFPFRDSIDHGARFGVSHVAHPGGSIQDESVTRAADEHNMTLSFTGVRMFVH